MDVALFVTCLTDTFYPRVGEAVVRVLRHFGCRVHFPKRQTCCGQPAYNSGFHHEAAALIRRLVKVFQDAEHIVTPSASCATMVRRHGPALLTEEAGASTARQIAGGQPLSQQPNHDRSGATSSVVPEERSLTVAARSRAAPPKAVGEIAVAQQVAGRVHEFATFLRDELRLDIGALVRFDEPVTFHYPCHARDVYTVDDLRRWLGNGELVRTPARPDLCCGFGGLFAVEYPELSGAMLGDKLDELVRTGARLVICNEAACTLQMAGGARRRGLPLRFKHLAEVLAESLGLMEPAP